MWGRGWGDGREEGRVAVSDAEERRVLKLAGVAEEVVLQQKVLLWVLFLFFVLWWVVHAPAFCF